MYMLYSDVKHDRRSSSKYIQASHLDNVVLIIIIRCNILYHIWLRLGFCMCRLDTLDCMS